MRCLLRKLTYRITMLGLVRMSLRCCVESTSDMLNFLIFLLEVEGLNFHNEDKEISLSHFIETMSNEFFFSSF